MTTQEYLFYKFMFMEYGRDLLAEFVSEPNLFNLPSFKDLSKDYVTYVKEFLNEVNKDAPDEVLLKKHIAKLGKQHYKMYIKLK